MTDHRIKLLRLLAEIDQRIQEAESIASDATLSKADRRFADVQLAFRRNALKQVEKLISDAADVE